MNLADYLRRQFSYDEWANREVLNAIRSAGDANQRSLQLMSHILAAELVWLERLKQQPQSVPVWPEPDLAQCEAQAAQLGRRWLFVWKRAAISFHFCSSTARDSGL